MQFRNFINKALRVLAAAAVGVSALAYLPENTTAEAATWSGLTGEELVAKMSVGWNLGNTLESTGSWLEGKSVTGYETGWGNPKTTKAMIDAVKKQGFTSLRIPVTWTNHFNKSTGKIDADWLARVKEVVDYGIDNGMVVILNTHHEDWIDVSNSGYSSTNAILTKLWKSIATEFKSYDQHLIFESMNEPRQDDDWTGKTEYYSNVNKLNAAFVSTVRATGGNNSTRGLLIPGYCASSNQAALAAITVPDDDNVIVSVHAYVPYNFALQPESTVKTLTASGRREISNVFSNINKYFLSKGIPVIMGECSATYRQNNNDERIEWADYYISMAKQYGVPCLIWDNNQYTSSNNGEQHGYLNRKTLKWYNQTMVDTIVNAWKNTPSGIPAQSTSSSKTQMSKLSISGISSTYKYTGGAIRPKVTVKNGSKTLTQGTDYTVTYTDNVAKGTGQVVLTGKGNYSGTVTKSFSITATGKADTTTTTTKQTTTTKKQTTTTKKQTTTTTKKQTTTKSAEKTTKNNGAGNVTTKAAAVTTAPASTTTKNSTSTNETTTGSETSSATGTDSSDQTTMEQTTAQTGTISTQTPQIKVAEEDSGTPVGVYVGVTVGLLALGAVIFFLLWKNKKSK